MSTTRKILKAVFTSKEARTGILLLLGVSLFVYVALSMRDCGSEGRSAVTALVETQKESGELLLRVLATNSVTQQQLLQDKVDFSTQIRDLQVAYELKLSALEKSLAERDTAIREDFGKRLKERGDQLRKEYNDVLDNPEAARDAFLDALSLWDDLWSRSPGGHP